MENRKHERNEIIGMMANIIVLLAIMIMVISS